MIVLWEIVGIGFYNSVGDFEKWKPVFDGTEERRKGKVRD